VKGASKNPKYCVTLPRQNAHLRQVNSAFVSVASLDIEISRSSLKQFNGNNFYKQTRQKTIGEKKC
jgi:hypothetical protein